MTASEFPDSGWASISPKASGMTCHDTPNRSVSQPQGPSLPPSESLVQTSSSSSCVSQDATKEKASEKRKDGPPSKAVYSCPLSSKAAWSTLPFGIGLSESLRTMSTILESLNTEV